MVDNIVCSRSIGKHQLILVQIVCDHKVNMGYKYLSFLFVLIFFEFIDLFVVPKKGELQSRQFNSTNTLFVFSIFNILRMR